MNKFKFKRVLLIILLLSSGLVTASDNDLEVVAFCASDCHYDWVTVTEEKPLHATCNGHSYSAKVEKRSRTALSPNTVGDLKITLNDVTYGVSIYDEAYKANPRQALSTKSPMTFFYCDVLVREKK
jgi:uncharacterized FAD-dependent dehydrogenase